MGRGMSVGIRKGNPELLEKINDEVEAAKADCTIRQLSAKWFGFDVMP
nr:transporter substrate-binding domain-containing protein [Ochrobactrum sp. Marseille-Q0166]